MLSEQLHKRFVLARPWFALSATYAVSFVLAALFIHLTRGAGAADYQAAFFANSVSLALLWAALLLARPKPKQPRMRSIYAACEYLLVGFILSLALILFFHHGWRITADAPTGFAAIAWGIGWIGAWVGPLVVGILTLLFAHWLWLSIFIDYRRACWQFMQEARIAALLSEVAEAIQESEFLRPKDAEYVGRKLIQWHATTKWKPFELALPSSGVHLHGYLQSQETAARATLVLEKLAAQGADTILQSITFEWPHEPVTE